MKMTRLLLSCTLCAVFALCGAGASAQFVFEKGDHVALIGNALPDRMQHDGWLEALLQATNPDKQLVIRNLGFTGDTVSYRPRNKNFPSEHEYLSLVEADVIFAFFGYNESFEQNPAKFKEELGQFIDDTRSRRYNGRFEPRIVLFSPIAFEDSGSPNLPDGTEHNFWLSIYSDAMARVAQVKKVAFVDLFSVSQRLYEDIAEPLTINGVHLNSSGNRELARVMVEELHGDLPRANLDLIRDAVLEKNRCWFNRYRATDGNDVWGTRSTLKFVNEQTNAEVLQHELVMLDLMTANRDSVIWRAVQGEATSPDDSNVPHPILVESNYAPSEKTGALRYVGAEEGISYMTLARGMKANLFASEETFPELVNPVQIDVDTKGRVWAAVWQTYPKWQPDREMLDRLVILPDDNRDGVADRALTFAFVHNPTGFTFWNGGVVVASAPNIWFLKDIDGDDRADVREILFSGIDAADTHHSANGFDYGPDGYIYYQRGIFNVSNVETPWAPGQLSGTSAMYRFNPRTHRFSLHAPNSPNPHGGDFDYWGYHYATDATSGQAFQVRIADEGKFEMHKLLEKTVRPVPSSGILSSLHFPPENNQNFIILNAIGFLGIKQYTLENNEGVVWGTETEDLLVSSDGNFRPSDFKVGDDGALYVADWENAIIGHMQHNIRDPNRDHEHGRIYRITVEGRPLQDHVEIDGQPIERLLEVLKHPVDGVRLRARIELSERDTEEVIAAVQQWAAQFNPSSAEDAHPLLEALWLHQQHNVVNENLLEVLLNSPEPHARRAAERVRHLWEIEGHIGEGADAAPDPGMDHTAHAGHGLQASVAPDPRTALLDDYLVQENSPEPALDGDTLVVHIYTVKEQMRYDRPLFTVAPGMKVRLVFKNPDAMDHNLIMVQPGAVQEVAMAALLLGANGVKLDWTPKSDKIMFASELLSIGEEQTIEFSAPANPGRYEYVCTFPGHWQLMRGVMIVEDGATGIGQLTDASRTSASDDFWAEFTEASPAPAPAPAAEIVIVDQAPQPAENLTLADGFSAELLYTATPQVEGSWVALTQDPQGRLYVSDEGGKGLFRIAVAPMGDANATTKVERIDVALSGAQGMCWLRGSLYVNVADAAQAGVWRIRDTDGDDTLDSTEHLVPLVGGGEHGPHALLPTEDGKGLYFSGGNNTRTPPYALSRVPANWAEDVLLANQWDGHGNPRELIPPGAPIGGWIARCDLNGKSIELIGTGFRNPYDVAMNAHGELITTDMDTEWDLGMPWYRPARLYHVVSGGEYGWRPGSAKWPSYYEDTVAPMLELGPGSPKGILFGAGAEFPGRYQRALLALDWRFGKIYALHLRPEGATYRADAEDFAVGRPFAAADAVVGKDGALYVVTGGRSTQSKLYRISYRGSEPTAPVAPDKDGDRERKTRHMLESLHVNVGAKAVTQAWPYLGHEDRSIRYAARIALEHQPVDLWRGRASVETDAAASPTAFLALARQGDRRDYRAISDAQHGLNLSDRSEAQQLTLLRAYGLALLRLGEIEGALHREVQHIAENAYPEAKEPTKIELAQLLVYLKSPTVVERTVPLLATPAGDFLPPWASVMKAAHPADYVLANYGGTVHRMLNRTPPSRQLAYAFLLRNVEEGWTPPLRQKYFEFFHEAAKRSGGPKYREFLSYMRAEALDACTESERTQLATFTEVPLIPSPPSTVSPPQGPGKMWTFEEALATIGPELSGRDFESGQNLFHAAACSLCHQFNGMGGVGGAIGPDLSSVSAKYSTADLLKAILTPSEAVPDQYGAVVARTKDGQTILGRPVEGVDTIQVIAENAEAPPRLMERSAFESVAPSPVSQMPLALVNMLNAEELRDLVAYLLSGGDRKAPMFKK